MVTLEVSCYARERHVWQCGGIASDRWLWEGCLFCSDSAIQPEARQKEHNKNSRDGNDRKNEPWCAACVTVLCVHSRKRAEICRCFLESAARGCV